MKKNIDGKIMLQIQENENSKRKKNKKTIFLFGILVPAFVIGICVVGWVLFVQNTEEGSIGIDVNEYEQFILSSLQNSKKDLPKWKEKNSLFAFKSLYEKTYKGFEDGIVIKIESENKKTISKIEITDSNHSVANDDEKANRVTRYCPEITEWSAEHLKKIVINDGTETFNLNGWNKIECKMKTYAITSIPIKKFVLPDFKYKSHNGEKKFKSHNPLRWVRFYYGY